MFSPGPAPQSQTRTYAESDAGIALTVTTTGADGKQSTTNLTFKEDGKPYPATGNPEFDAVKVKRINARQKGTDASGAKYDNVAVYDRQ